ncbi:hypothetical protein [Aminobacter sp. BE322]|uniref:hypothetical protein n=1 Tax=unclassified Aminobacter TaxID=2644704 RepID=UPI003D1D0084
MAHADTGRPLRILMTNAVMRGRSVTETLVRDMVLALRRRFGGSGVAVSCAGSGTS